MNRMVVLIALIIFAASSCQIDPCINKKFFLSEYEKFTDNVFDEHEDLSEKEWKVKDEKMDQFINECYNKYKEKLSDEEKEDIWIDYFKYKYYRHGESVMRAIEEDVKRFSIEIDKELEGLFDDPEEDVRKILKELYGEDINQAIDEFVKGIQDLGDLIKEWLEQE